MSERHHDFWPTGLPRHLTVPQTNLFYNLEVSAARYPDKTFSVFYDTPLSYREFKREVEQIAGYLEQECGVRQGDRVLLYMQNSPQFMLAYYAILRANAVVVPVNPMNLLEELRHYVSDTGATTIFAPQDLYAQVAPLVASSGEPGLQHVLVAAYSDYIDHETDLKVPDFVAAPRRHIAGPGVTLWSDMLARGCVPGPVTAGPDDLACMP